MSIPGKGVDGSPLPGRSWQPKPITMHERAMLRAARGSLMVDKSYLVFLIMDMRGFVVQGTLEGQRKMCGPNALPYMKMNMSKANAAAPRRKRQILSQGVLESGVESMSA